MALKKKNYWWSLRNIQWWDHPGLSNPGNVVQFCTFNPSKFEIKSIHIDSFPLMTMLDLTVMLIGWSGLPLYSLINTNANWFKAWLHKILIFLRISNVCWCSYHQVGSWDIERKILLTLHALVCFQSRCRCNSLITVSFNVGKWKNRQIKEIWSPLTCQYKIVLPWTYIYSNLFQYLVRLWVNKLKSLRYGLLGPEKNVRLRCLLFHFAHNLVVFVTNLGTDKTYYRGLMILLTQLNSITPFHFIWVLNPLNNLLDLLHVFQH